LTVRRDLPNQLGNFVDARIAFRSAIRDLVHPLRLVVAADVPGRLAADCVPEVEQLAVQQAAEVRDGRALPLSDDDR